MRGAMLVGLVLAAAIVGLGADEVLPKAPANYVLKVSREIAPGAAVTLLAEDRGADGEAKAFEAARKAGKPGYDFGVAVQIVSAGPRLDMPDTATVGAVEKKDGVFSLKVNYTRARVRGQDMLKNIQWTPLAVAPLRDLEAGEHKVKVTWHCTDKAAEGRKVPEDLVLEGSFILERK